MTTKLTETIGSEWYTSEKIFEEEKEIFYNFPQAILSKKLHSKEYVAHNLINKPLIIFKDEQNNLKAFYNVCRHKRATLLEGCGILSKTIVCPYHGWSYDLNGNLCGTPECTLDNKGNFNLTDLRIEQFYGLNFVWSSNKQYKIKEYLKPISDIPDFNFHKRLTYNIKCNWKVFCENFLDGGYHIRTIHPDLSKITDYSKYTTEIYENVVLQKAPLKSGDLHDVRGNFAYYWWIFPNLMINIYDDTMDIGTVLPTGVNTCEVIMDFYFKDQISEEFKNKSIDVAHSIQIEDVDICERVQKGLISDVYENGPYCIDRESGICHFHNLLKRNICHM